MSIARFVLLAAVGLIAVTMHGCEESEEDSEGKASGSMSDACAAAVAEDADACQVFKDAGASCSQTWTDMCGGDHPAGAEYNSYTLVMGCPDC